MSRCVKRAPLPKYGRRGWHGGDTDTLYTFTDKRTGQKMVRPGEHCGGIGPEVTVRAATRSEAVEHWQPNLHPAWKVDCG